VSSVGPAPSDAPIPLLLPEQAKLAQVWAGMIGIDVNDIRPTDNFFDLGGDSLLAIAAIDEAGRVLGFRVEAKRYVFETLAQLAVNQAPATAAAAPESIPEKRGLFGRMKASMKRTA